MRLITLTAAIVLAMAFATSGARAQSGADLFQKALAAERADGNLRGAIQLYERVVKEFPSDRALVARALVRIAECYERLGQRDASKVYERVVREFGDQRESASTARARLEALQSPRLPPAQTVRQIWSGQGVDALGKPSLDGRFLTFTDWTTGDLSIRDLVDGTNRRLTNTGGWVTSGDFAEFSAISPDGRSVAYAWFTDKGERPDAKTCVCRYGLRVLPLNGGGQNQPRILHESDGTVWVRPTGWTPDSRQVLVARQLQGRLGDLAMVDVTTGTLRVISTFDVFDSDGVHLSPDGRFVVVDEVSKEQSAANITVISVADGSRIPLIQGPSHDRAPMWTADGRHVLFISDRSGTDSIWRVPVANGKATGAPALVLSSIGNNSWLMGSTSSGALFFSSGGPNSDVLAATLNPDGRAVGAPAIAVEQFVGSNGAPSWSPDGDSIAFLSRRGARQATVIMTYSFSTRRAREVPTSIRPADRVAWFPDGRSLLVASVDQTRLAYSRVDVDSGAAEPLVTSLGRPIPGRRPMVAPDGSAFYFADSDRETDMAGGARRIVRFDLATRQQTVISRTAADDQQFSSVQLSPDGTQIAYLRGNNVDRTSALEVMSRDGSNVRELHRSIDVGPTRMAGLSWTPDGRYVVMVRPEKDGIPPPTALWKVPVAGGAPQPMGISAPFQIRHPAISPKGNRIVYTAGDGGAAASISVLENFLPRASGQ